MAHGIQMLHAGKEGTFFYLLDLPRAALPLLFRELDLPANRRIAPEILRGLWESRDPRVVDRLGQALHDSDPRLWKEALNGLVAIAGPASLSCLRETRDLIATRGTLPNGLDLAWVDEAIEQASAREAGRDSAAT